MKRLNKSRKEFLIFLIALLVLPIFIRNQSVIHIFIMCFLYSMVVVSWDLLMGYAGVFAFSQIAFFTIGAYSSAIFTKSFGISPWFGLLIGACIASLTGILIGLPVLRLKGGLYIALVTFALHEALIAFIILGRPIGTGGATSLTSIPPISIAGYIMPVTNRIPWYYLSLLVAFSAYYIIYSIIHSSYGIAFIALRDSAEFAKSLGIDDYKSKLLVFGVTAFIAGMSGALYAHYMRLVSIRILGLDIFLLILVMLIVGGLGKFPGALLATFLFNFLNEFLRPLEVYRPIILGITVILVIVFIPGGIGQIIDYLKEWLYKKKLSPDAT